jgi:uncharacterized membrane protein
MRRHTRWLCIALIPAACIGYQWLVHALLVHADAASMRGALAALNGVPHALINLSLLGVFARTLAARREPLITGFARRIHGTVPVYIESYTRHVTQAWCVFFAAQILLSAGLFIFAALDIWSLFVNVLTLPLIVLMFVSEYGYRRVRFPNFSHVSIWQGIQAFVNPPPAAKAADARAQN